MKIWNSKDERWDTFVRVQKKYLKFYKKRKCNLQEKNSRLVETYWFQKVHDMIEPEIQNK